MKIFFINYYIIISIMSEFYDKFKKSNNLIYLHLAYLNGYNLALKHLEYLDKENMKDYLLMYHRNNDFAADVSKIINTFFPYKCILSNWEEIWFSNNKLEDTNLEKYYEKMKTYLPISLNEHLAMIVLYDLYGRKTGKENDFFIAEKLAIKLLDLWEYLDLTTKVIIFICLSKSANKEIQLKLKKIDLNKFNSNIELKNIELKNKLKSLIKN
jgi:hypothetical protein